VGEGKSKTQWYEWEDNVKGSREDWRRLFHKITCLDEYHIPF
jgi:hypothetical protein